MAKPKTFRLPLTLRELELVFVEFNASVSCGAEDADFEIIRDKAQKLLAEANRSTAQGAGDL